MNRALVSVVIPTYNRGHLIARALRSALAECNEGDEIIVVDDASTDNAAEVVARFPRVTYLKAEHGGAGRARNLGIQFSKHPLVSFLDSDDEWLPGGLMLKCALLQARPELVLCFSNFAGTVRDGTLHHGALAGGIRTRVLGMRFLLRVYRYPPLPHCPGEVRTRASTSADLKAMS